MSIEKGKVVDKLAKLGSFFQVSVDVTIKSFPKTKTLFNILQIGDGSESGYGSQVPSVNFLYDPNEFISQLVFKASFGKHESHEENFFIILNKTYHIEITQQLENESIQLTMAIDGIELFKGENTRAQQFSNMQVFLSNPWSIPFTSEIGTVENLEVFSDSKCWKNQQPYPKPKNPPKCEYRTSVNFSKL